MIVSRALAHALLPLLLLLLLVAGSSFSPAGASQCASCRLAAWNCSTRDEQTTTPTATTTTTTTTPELRHGDGTHHALVPRPLEVCDAQGRIQVDDIFCDSDECACAADKRCVSLELGCRNIHMARSRKRCIGPAAVQSRFEKCAIAQQLTDRKQANLDADWVNFKSPSQCESADCRAVRHLNQCGVVQCGYLIVAWRETTASGEEYRFVVDGSRESDMAAGTFLFSASEKLANSASPATCAGISSAKIDACYSLQTRNHKNGTCDGVYFQVDTTLTAMNAGEKYQLSTLSWPVWLTVVGSVAAALGAVTTVVVMYVRLRRLQRDDAHAGIHLLGVRSIDADADVGAGAADLEPQRSTSTSSARDLRQRTLSPTSQSRVEPSSQGF
ncbi:hypothetical protein PINS_up002534 [Pythium insidiosum]|nr:hypothetical protein PINS_up002534 [Pythium insidiosum]